MRFGRLLAFATTLAAPGVAHAVRVWEEPRADASPALPAAATPPAPAPSPAPPTPSVPTPPAPAPSPAPPTPSVPTAPVPEGSAPAPGSSATPGEAAGVSPVTPAAPRANAAASAPATPAAGPTAPRASSPSGVMGALQTVFTGSVASPDLRPGAGLTPLAAGGHVGASRYPEGVAYRWLDIGFFSQPRLAAQTGFNADSPSNFSVPPGVNLRRTRIVIHGQAHPLLQVRLEFNISDRIQLLDAYALVPVHRAFQLQLGQFRVPFSRQELVSSSRLQFNDSALWSGAANGSGIPFVPSFDLGVMLWGWVGPNDLFEYYAGVFNGEGPNQLQNQDGFFLYAGRVVLNPLGRPAALQESAINLPSRPAMQFGLNVAAQTRQIGLVTLAPGAAPVPNRLNALAVGADVALFGWGASLYAELYYRDLRETDTRAAPSTESLGWLVQVGYLVPHPALREHLELTARVQDFDPTNCFFRAAGVECGVRPIASATPEVYRDFQHTIAYTLGVNWYQSGHGFKVSANYTVFNEQRDIAGDVPGSGVVDNDLFTLQVTGSF